MKIYSFYGKNSLLEPYLPIYILRVFTQKRLKLMPLSISWRSLEEREVQQDLVDKKNADRVGSINCKIYKYSLAS